MQFSDRFSTILKHYRLKKKLTQQELAEIVDVGLRTYQRLEMGEANPTIEVLTKLSVVLEFKFSEIFKYEENKSPEYEILENTTKLLIRACRVAKVGTGQYDYLSKLAYVSPMAGELLEVDEDFIPQISSLWSLIKQGENRESLLESITQIQKEEGAFRKEVHMISAKGKEFIVNMSAQTEFENGVCKRIYGTIQDITEYKQKVSELQKLLQEFEDIQSFAGLGRWRLDLVKNQLRWSSSLYEIFEIDKDKFPASYEAFLNLVHPDDRKLVDEAYSNSLKDRKPYESQHRLLMPDGRIKWIQERCRTEFSESGVPLVSVGYALDVTRYK